jgi:hypothetical protein
MARRGSGGHARPARIAAATALALLGVAACTTSGPRLVPLEPAAAPVSDATADPVASGERAVTRTWPPRAPSAMPRPAVRSDPPHPGDTPAEVLDDLFEVEKIVDTLFDVAGRQFRDVLQRPLGAPLEARDIATLQALFAGPERAQRTLELQRFLDHQEYRATLFPPETIGPERFRALHLHEVSADCVTVFGWVDQSRSSRTPVGPDDHVALVLARGPDTDPGLNPTSWRLWDNNLLRSLEGPIPREQWPELTFGSVLDTTCGREGHP